MNKLPLEKRTQIINLLVEGNSLRATSRIADVSINTVTKLLVSVGKACQEFHNNTVVNIKSERVQCDENWSFCYSKQKNVSQEMPEGAGDVWTWTALDADSKLIVSWFVGDREAGSAYEFMNDVANRLQNRVQLTTDGHKPLLKAVENAFNNDIDYAMLVKMYGGSEGTNRQQKKYSPAKCTGCKKIENHGYAIALHFVYYNFCKLHKSLSVTPAMQAGLTKRFMKIEDIVMLADIEAPKKRGNYKTNQNQIS